MNLQFDLVLTSGGIYQAILEDYRTFEYFYSVYNSLLQKDISRFHLRLAYMFYLNKHEL